jgi:translocator protein
LRQDGARNRETRVSEIASKGQLRQSFLRWAAVTVPLIVLLGFLSGSTVAAGNDSGWYRALAKPSLTPPGWAFPVAWTIIYVCLGLALAAILNARRARGRGLALLLFVLSFAGALAWMPLFFGAHRVTPALLLIVWMVVTGSAAAVAFSRIRRTAGWLLLPYLVWISFAGVLTWRIGQLNPDAERLAPGQRSSQIL